MLARGRAPLTLKQIVEGGLCIGCGLCRSVAGPERVEIVMTPEGRERPIERTPLDPAVLARINEVCPGTRVAGPDPRDQSEAPERDEACRASSGSPGRRSSCAAAAGGPTTATGT